MNTSNSAVPRDAARLLRPYHKFRSLIRESHRTSQPFCFVLGAGASKSSGVPLGGELARRWLGEIESDWRRLNPSANPEIWFEQVTKRLPGWTPATTDVFYSKIYDWRFDLNEKLGHDHLRSLIQGKRPGIGYAYLARLMVGLEEHTLDGLRQAPSRHHVVVTVNFDNLVAEALALFEKRNSLVCGHEALASQINLSSGAPLVIKLHADLMLRPRSRTQDLCTLAAPWQQVLGDLVTRYRLIFLGYGGNDLGFMRFLAEGLEPGRCAFEPVWGFFSPNPQDEEQESLPANPLVHRFLQNQGGALFPVPSFDVVMRAVLEETGTPPPTADDVKARTEEIVAVFRSGQESAEHEWRAISLDKTVGQMSPVIPPVMSVEETNRDVDGFDWRIRARAAATTDEAIALFKEALRRTPDDLDLIVAYATYLHRRDVQHDDAEMLYQRALAQSKATGVKREHAWWIGSYALFLEKVRKDFGLAEEYYQRAVEADPKNANYLDAFAWFLESQRKDFDRAEEYYERAVEADPKHASSLGNYADFLEQRRKDFDRAEDFYQRAVEADPKNAFNLSRFAEFLKERERFEEAENFYQRSVEADPKYAFSLCRFAEFLKERERFEEAETFYLRAVEANPKNAFNLGNYADFLNGQERFEAAETFYQRAVEADPENANNLANYARFLWMSVGKPDVAALRYAGLERLEGLSADALFACAVFCHLQLKDHPRAEALYDRALAVDGRHAYSLGSSSQLLLARGEEKVARERLTLLDSLSEVVQDVRLEAAVCRLIHFPESWPAGLKPVKDWVTRGVRSEGWDFTPNLQRAEACAHANLPLLKALASVITAKADPSILDAFPEWQAA